MAISTYKVKVRWAAVEDRDPVKSLFLASMQAEGVVASPAAFARSWRQAVDRSAGFRFTVADLGRAGVVGAMTLHRHYSTYNGRSTVSVEDVIVDSHHRGIGVGTQMLEFASRFGREIGAARLELHVGASNRARSLYLRHGFEPLPYAWLIKGLRLDVASPRYGIQSCKEGMKRKPSDAEFP